MGAMEALIGEMLIDRHDPMSVDEAQTSVEALRVLEARCAAAEMIAGAALAAFRVESVPVNVGELRGAYSRTQARVAEIHDLAMELMRQHLQAAADQEAMAAACASSDDETIQGMAEQHRAAAEEFRRKAQKCQEAAMAALEALEALQIGHRGLQRCRGMEDAHTSFPGGPARPTDAYAQ